MSKHVIIDLGHSKCDSGAVANGFKEVDLNISIGRYAGNELSRHGVVVTYAEGSLSDRSKLENRLKPNAFISIHNNAGGGDGTEVFHYPSSVQGQKLANVVYNQCINIDKLNNGRGVKTANYHVLRETTSPSILIECAFMDSADIQAVDEEHERKAYGISIAKGILKYLGINYIPESAPVAKGDTYFRVIVGSYKDRSNAEAQQRKLKEKGFDSFLEAFKK